MKRDSVRWWKRKREREEEQRETELFADEVCRDAQGPIQVLPMDAENSPDYIQLCCRRALPLRGCGLQNRRMSDRFKRVLNDDTPGD